MQSDKSWSDCAPTYGYNALIPDYFTEVAAGLLLGTVPVADGINFLDVAAGLGSLSIDTCKLLSEEQRTRSSFEITDFSEGMIAYAKLTVLEKESFQNMSTSNKFDLMDAEALQFPDESFSHAGCMFGIMFFPHLRQGLSEMYRVLKVDGGVVIGTWNQIGNMPVVLGFAQYLNTPNLSDYEASLQSIVSVCGDVGSFKQELEAVGFRNIAVSQVSKTFYLPNDEKFFQANATNAAMCSAMGGSKALDNYAKWQEYLRTDGAKWVNSEGQICLDFIANIAVAVK